VIRKERIFQEVGQNYSYFFSRENYKSALWKSEVYKYFGARNQQWRIGKMRGTAALEYGGWCKHEFLCAEGEAFRKSY